MQKLAKLDQIPTELFELSTYLDGMAAQQFVNSLPYFRRQVIFTVAERARHRFQNGIFTELRLRVVFVHRMVFNEPDAIAEIDVALGHRIQAGQQLQLEEYRYIATGVVFVFVIDRADIHPVQVGFVAFVIVADVFVTELVAVQRIIVRRCITAQHCGGGDRAQYNQMF